MQFASLYIVATPIGNLGDMTHRGVAVLKAVNLIAAEDTRHSQHLLAHYEITTPLISLHEYNETARVGKIINRLQQGENVALIADAGTPLISDPGYRLVNAVLAAGFAVVPVPGPCAAIAALTASGLATDRFVFEGFLPVKQMARKQRLLVLKQESRTVILYESVHRIMDLLELLQSEWGTERIVVMARELTKRFETIKRASVSELFLWMKAHPEQQKGEFVILLEGAAPNKDQELDAEIQRVLQILLASLPLKQAVDLAMQICGAKRKQIYRFALEMKATHQDNS